MSFICSLIPAQKWLNFLKWVSRKNGKTYFSTTIKIEVETSSHPDDFSDNTTGNSNNNTNEDVTTPTKKMIGEAVTSNWQYHQFDGGDRGGSCIMQPALVI